jgi:DNA polymerase
MDRTDELKKIRDEVIALKESPLYAARIRPVIGEGNHHATMMFIGEAPGRTESEQGRPFCGAAGKILDELLHSAGIERKEVYITNILKDRPPRNRDPLPEEIALYAPFLKRQMAIIQPRVLVALGRFAMTYVLDTFHVATDSLSISALHGTAFPAEAEWGKIDVVVLYHPAVAVYNAGMKAVLETDIAVLKQYL